MRKVQFFELPKKKQKIEKESTVLMKKLEKKNLIIIQPKIYIHDSKKFENSK